VITGNAPPGSTETIQKQFDLYTAPILQNTTPVTTAPPQAISTDLEQVNLAACLSWPHSAA
jgi:hypothetical protein